jgi:hypothetical protein
MAVTKASYTGDGSTVLFSIPFPYIQRSDIVVLVNSVSTSAFTFANATTIQFNVAPLLADSIEIVRETDTATLRALLSVGSSLRASDLNNNFIQGLYVAQESTNVSQEAFNEVQSAKNNAAAAVVTANAAQATSIAAASTANSAQITANNAAATANDAVNAVSSAIYVEPVNFMFNFALRGKGIGLPGEQLFGVGPAVISTTPVGLGPHDYFPIDLPSGSFM